jgi:hypothetical protein
MVSVFIKTVAVGNGDEAFIEKRLNKGFNIIYSTEDNNKGKTIVIQSMMYALGNQPIFPLNFPYKNYYHLCEVVNEDITYRIMRKKDQFLVLIEKELLIYDSVAEFKKFLKDHLFNLPRIKTNGRESTVYPFLFYQMFFIGQDKRTCSDISPKNQYRKNDFKEMVWRFGGIDSPPEPVDDIDIKEKIRILEEQKENLQKQNKTLLKGGLAEKQLYSVSDTEEFESKTKRMKEINQQITEIRKERNRIKQRIIKTENLIVELSSLNKKLDLGHVVCSDCGSKNISYYTKDDSFVFDVSNKEVQSEILASLNRKIETLNDELDEKMAEINNQQL